MVAVSTASIRSSTSALDSRSSSARRISSVHARLVEISTSEAMIDLASRISPPRTL